MFDYLCLDNRYKHYNACSILLILATFNPALSCRTYIHTGFKAIKIPSPDGSHKNIVDPKEHINCTSAIKYVGDTFSTSKEYTYRDYNSREGIAEILRGNLLPGGVHVSPHTGMIRTPTPTNSSSKNGCDHKRVDSSSSEVLVFEYRRRE